MPRGRQRSLVAVLALVAVLVMERPRGVRAEPLEPPENPPQRAATPPDAEQDQAEPQPAPQAQPPRRPPQRVQINLFQLRGRGQAVVADEEPVDLGDAATFVEDRSTMQILIRAERLLEEERYGEAVRHLGTILEAEEDYFFQPDKSKPTHRSLKADARRLIGEMPREGRESYELQYGAEARQMLDEALERGDASALADVSRRFFHTIAGYDATLVLGDYLLDRGQPLAAALCFERLLRSASLDASLKPTLSVKLAACWARAGMTEKAIETLQELRQQHRGETVQVAGREVELFDDLASATDWLATHLDSRQPHQRGGDDRWLMFRGDASRNGITQGSSPLLEPRWRVPTAIEPRTEELIARLRQAYLDRNVCGLPALHPLIVDDVVLMRTSNNLLAVDFSTGKRLWEVPVDDGIGRLLEGDSSAGNNPRATFDHLSVLEQRMWEDATYGTLSSDGRYVFSIEDLGTESNGSLRQQVFGFNGRRQPVPSGPRGYNRLAAHEIRTGKLKWEAGGPQGEFGLHLAGAFFLGPPLPLSGRLYALAEQNSEIRLLALDAQTGRADWSQQLAVVERDIMLDPLRRLAGATPSYADGVLVCPTAAGAVVAVDLTTRSLLWGYRFPVRQDGRSQFMAQRVGGIVTARGSSQNENSRWADASVVIADGCVLLTPVESEELHCLDLLDGSVLWKRPREDNLYLACVRNGQVLLIGESSARCLRLSDGESAWASDVTLDAMPSGYGFVSGNQYFLPLASAEVIAINIETGAIESRAKSRKGNVPGNLISYQGQIISQNVDWVESFYQFASLEQRVAAALERRPDDPVALALNGELLLHQGKLESAIADLRRSHQLQPNPRTRELLVDALLEGLESNFEANQEAAAEIEQLVEQPADRAAFHRVMAAGLKRQGRHSAAFEAYLKLADSLAGASELERIDDIRSVRRDRWVQAGIASLRDAASDADRATMDHAIARRLESALQSRDPDGLRQFIEFFGRMRLADEAREGLIDRLSGSETLLERQLHLARLEQSDDDETARRAVARLARLLRDAGRSDEALTYYERLAGEFADVECLDGKTGRELLAELQPDETLQRRLSGQSLWPDGAVETTHLDETNQQQRFYPCEIEGDRGPFYKEMTVEVDHGQAIQGRDGLGHVRWRLPLNEPGSSTPRLNINPAVVRGKVHGHLLVLSLGEQLLAIDTLAATGGRDTVRVLWSREITDSLPGVAMHRGIHANQMALPWGGRKTVVADSYGKPIGQIGPLTADHLCFQESRKLVAVHPRTGEVLWTRLDVEPGSDLFGDDDYLFVVEPGAAEALVLDPLDGRELARRAVPPGKNRMTTIGRRVLVWDDAGARQQIRLVDPWTEDVLWEHGFTNARCDLLGQDAVGIVETGRFTLLNLRDGKPLIQAPVDPLRGMHEIFLLGTETQILLITNSQASTRSGVFIRPVPGGMNRSPLVNGYVYGFDRRTGERVWSRRIDRQGLSLDQPSLLPVLVFASIVYERQQQNARNSNHVKILCIDKRSGRTVYQEQTPGPDLANFDLDADLKNRVVDLKLLRKTVRMKFTDKPFDDGEEAADDAEAEEEQTSIDPDGDEAPQIVEAAPIHLPEREQEEFEREQRQIAAEKARQQRLTVAPRPSPRREAPLVDQAKDAREDEFKADGEPGSIEQAAQPNETEQEQP